MAEPQPVPAVAPRHGPAGLRNKVVWLTGASSGIGAALAVELASQGACIVLSARRQAELERVQALCGAAAADTMILPFDLTDFDSSESYAKQVIDRYGRLDVLINNAGVSQRALAEQTSLEVDRRVMDVDYFGQVALTKAALPYLIAAGRGHIVVVSSLTGKVPIPLRSAYCAAKHALHGFFATLRAEVARHGIAVTLICAPNVKTAISINALTGSGATYGKMDPLQEHGMSPQACARRVVVAIRKRKAEVLMGALVKNVVTLHRLFPGLYRRLLARRKKFV
jgi:dehydrogenase/reductase SDR family protein 7B